MIIDKHKHAYSKKDEELKATEIDAGTPEQDVESVEVNALCEVFYAIKQILQDIKENKNDPNSASVFRTIKINNGQVNRLKNNKWNKEYVIGFPAVFVHFIDVRYLVQQARIHEGRATMRLQIVLNRLNNSDADHELEGFRFFQLVNEAIQERKGQFPALAQRCQLQYFNQLETFDDGLQLYWIDYEVWFTDYSTYFYKDYVERHVVIPPFTNHSDQNPESNPDNHEDHRTPNIEDVTSFN